MAFTAKGGLMYDELHWKAALGVVVPFLNAKHWRDQVTECVNNFGLQVRYIQDKMRS
jgi:hypothetical protein